MSPRRNIIGLILLSLAALLVFQVLGFNVLQDDAFISFRYVKNFLDGHGLVFNIGERVEGYTNFFWIMLLALLAKLGLPLIETARVAGVLAAIGTLGICIYAARRYYPEKGWVWVVAAPFLLAANGSFAYWAGSGLETALFTLLAAAAAVSYFSRPAFSLLFLALATLTRPEGALLAFLFGVIGVLLKQKNWKETLPFWGGLALLLLPFAIFKWFYYGSLLPNPFYAKTGLSVEYLQSGLEYVWLFLKHYGGYGLFIILPFLFWKKLSTFSRFALLVFTGYTLYLILIGGDVLKAHRFFVPILLFFYLPVTEIFHQLLGNRWYKTPAFVLGILSVSIFSYRAAFPYLRNAAFNELALIENMAHAAAYFAEKNPARSFAIATIGAFSYYVGNRRVIDMLGLTEPAIARNPETIEGIVSSWREKHFNAGYVLSQKPEVILFSTGVKPSAPAERALLLHPDFRRNYRLEFSYQEGLFDLFYHRFQNRPVGSGPDRPARFANLFNEAMNQLATKNHALGIERLRETIGQNPVDFSAVYIMLAYFYSLARQTDSVETYLKKGMELDGGGSLGRFYYRDLLMAQKRYAEAAVQDSHLIRMVPGAAELLAARKY